MGRCKIKNHVINTDDIIKQKFAEQGITEEETVKTSLKDLTDRYIRNYDAADTEEGLVNLIVGAAWLICDIMGNAITRINLLSLATTLSSRVGYRLEIYAGIATRP